MTDAINYKTWSFTGSTLQSVRYHKSASLAAAALDVNTLTAVVKCPDAGILDFAQDDPVTHTRGGSQISLSYVKEIKRMGPSRYSITTMSSVGRLTRIGHRGGVYDGDTVASVVSSICQGVPYYIQPNFAGIQVYGYLPNVAPGGENGAKKGSARDNLVRLLFAIGANLRTDASGTLRIENLDTAATSTLTASEVVMDGAADTHDTPVTSVSVIEHQYTAQAATDPVTLFDGQATAGQVIPFSGPMHSLEATGFTITESGANYAILSAGTGTLTGKPYTVTTREVTREVTVSAVKNDIRLTDTALVGITNSAEVLRRLAAYYRHREVLSCTASIIYQQPGDVVAIYNPVTGQTVNACIYDAEVVASQAQRGSISALVGFTPWQTVPFEDVREVLTGSGTWTVPAGVTDVTAIMIGGGDGGTSGTDGADATTLPINGAIGAAGGSAGLAGAGARVLRVELSVTGGQSIAYASGAGGAADQAGTDTTFGAYTTAAGQASPDGYFDAMSGETYALPGVDGVAGGAGSYFTGYSAPGGKTLHRPGPGASVEYEGITYRGGRAGSLVGDAYNFATGGGGGGAAVGSQGGDGTDAVSDYPPVPGAGGNGADAAAIPAKTVYGCGGDGGHGGGGGGKAGQSGGVNQNPMERPGTTPGKGGKGSAGGQGAPGANILYYRRPVQP